MEDLTPVGEKKQAKALPIIGGFFLGIILTPTLANGVASFAYALNVFHIIMPYGGYVIIALFLIFPILLMIYSYKKRYFFLLGAGMGITSAQILYISGIFYYPSFFF